MDKKASLDIIRKDNDFFKSMIDLIPPKFYFDKDQLNEGLTSVNANVSEEEPTEEEQESEEVPRKKGKRARYDPAEIKTVSQLQDALMAQHEDTSQGPKKPKKSPKAVEIKTSTESLEDLRQRLHAKIQAIQEKRKAVAKQDYTESKRLARRASKMKLKMRRAEEKHRVKSGHHKGAAQANGGLPPGGAITLNKPIFNKEGKVVFSKFDFTDAEKPKNDISKGKNYKKILEKVAKDKEKLEKLKESDQNKAKQQQKKMQWQSAIQKAEGIKVRDDPKMLKKSIKKQEGKKKKSQKEWTDRQEKLDKKKKEKQDKRKKNIQTKKQARIDKKIKKSKKKGHIIPGF